MGGELFHADGRTDGHDVAFRNFANATKKKANFALEQAMKAQRGRRDIAVLFLEPRR